MAITQLRSNLQLLDHSVTLVKMLDVDFLQGATWTLSSDNTAILDGLDPNPVSNNAAVTKGYVDGLVDSSMKSPDGFATTATGDYPSDYKSSGIVSEGDTFYVTDITNGTTVGTKSVNLGDLLVALVDTPGNTDSDWVIMETNRDQATETVKGVAQLATQAQTDAGTDDSTIVTPLKLDTYISNAGIQAYQAGNGLSIDTGTTPDTMILGGTLDRNTTLNTSTFDFDINGTGGTSITANDINLTSTVSTTITTGAGGTLTLQTNASNDAVLTQTPDGTVPLAIATVSYVTNSAVTASNGLTKNVNDIQLGGGLTSNTIINQDDNNLSIVTTTNGVGDFNIGTSATRLDNIDLYTENGTTIDDTTQIDLNSDQVNLNGTTGVILTASGTGVVVLNASANQSLLQTQVTGDGTSDPLAIATLKYVDDAITSNVTASNGLTKTGNDIALGGTLTADTTVDMSTFDMTFSGTGDFAVDVDDVYVDTNSISLYSTGSINIRSGSGGNVTLQTNASNEAVLTQQPDGTVALAVATTQYVDNAVSAITKVYNELPTVTGGSTAVTLANAPTAGTQRIYLNGIRQTPGSGNDYTISGANITFSNALTGTDTVLADYEY
jgi:hypothetical protein